MKLLVTGMLLAAIGMLSVGCPNGSETIKHTLTVTTPTNGTVEVKQGDTVIKAPYTVNVGITLTVTATPIAGYKFASWTGASTGATSPATITMDGDRTITASFLQMERVSTPEISPAGGYFEGSQVVTITCDTATASIHYTIDGSEPTSSSTSYTIGIPLRIGETTALNSSITVKAIGVKVGYSNSAIDERTFTKRALNTVLVQAGTFSTSGKGGHNVKIGKSYYMGIHEVTQGQYYAVMINLDDTATGGGKRRPSSNAPATGWENLPVEQVSWFDALMFCNALSEIEELEKCYTITKTGSPTDQTSWSATWDFTKNGYRLPTEAEWEYAARGGIALGANHTFKYAGSNNIDDVAWYVDNSGHKTQIVGLTKDNALGLFDMSGNVWEWCWDWRGNTYPSTMKDPTGADSGSLRVNRGGCFLFDADFCSVADRNSSYPSLSNDRFGGFRVVRSL